VSLLVHSRKVRKIGSEPKFWTKEYFRLFISHLSTDKILAHKIKESLNFYAISGFVAHSDIEPTKEWVSEIELALNTCNAGIAIMSPKFHESKWTDQEIGVIIGRDELIIPIRNGLDPYGFIGKYQAITYSDEKKLSEEIFNVLVRHEKTKKGMAYAVMTMFEASGSFSGAKRNLELVKKIEFWDDVLVKRLEKSVENNSQIERSFGLPDSINYLLSKLKE